MPAAQKPNKAVSVPVPPAGFEDAVRRAVSVVQGATAALLESLPAAPRAAPELATSLGVDKNLAWKVFRLVRERDRLAGGRFVLGPQAMGILLRAAQERGAPAELVEDLHSASAEFEDVVRTHAGDRASFEMLLSAAGPEPDESTEIALRRAAFRASGYFVGVQARAQVQTFIAAPSTSGDMVDGVSLRSLVDLRRIRAGAPVVIGRAACTDSGGVFLHPGGVETLDDSVQPGEMPLIPEFCTSPLPEFHRVRGERGFVEDTLGEGPVGSTGAITVAAGEVMRSTNPRTPLPGDELAQMVTRVRTPCEVVIADYIVRHDLYGPLRPTLDVYCDVMGEAMRRVEERPRYRRAVGERVEHLGRGVECAQTPEVPRYAKLLRHAFKRLDWDADAFDVYRVRMEFPFVPSSLVIVHEIPR
jgi:hypothetical protein